MRSNKPIQIMISAKRAGKTTDVEITDAVSGRRICNCTRIEFDPIDQDHPFVTARLTLFNVPVEVEATGRPVWIPDNKGIFNQVAADAAPRRARTLPNLQSTAPAHGCNPPEIQSSDAGNRRAQRSSVSRAAERRKSSAA